jgi:hypothetical protein
MGSHTIGIPRPLSVPFTDGEWAFLTALCKKQSIAKARFVRRAVIEALEKEVIRMKNRSPLEERNARS